MGYDRKRVRLEITFPFRRPLGNPCRRGEGVETRLVRGRVSEDQVYMEIEVVGSGVRIAETLEKVRERCRTFRVLEEAGGPSRPARPGLL